MRRIAGLVAAVLMLAGTSSPSAARGSTLVAATVSGSLVVAFHGDPAAGCQARGVCHYQGQTIWRPEEGMGAVLKLGRGQAELIVFGDPQVSSAGSGVFTRVERETSSGRAADCVDAAARDVTTWLPIRAGEISLQVPGAGTQGLATRCAGPLPADIASGLPAVRLTLSQARHGHRRLDLHGSGSFSAGGFAGTVRSTLVIGLKRPSGGGGSSTGTKVRIVSEQLTEVAAAGGLSEQFAGSTSPESCVLLDSCGLSGTLTVRPAAHSDFGTIEALGPVHRPIRDFLAALGLSSHGHTAGIAVFGELYWRALGNLTSVQQQDGVSCTDDGPGGQAALEILSAGPRLGARYAPIEPLRDRCPGPTPPFDQNALASTTFPRSTLANRTFTLALRTGRSFADDGYSGHISGALQLTVKRGKPVARIAPAPQD